MVKMVNVTCIGLFSLSNQIGERDGRDGVLRDVLSEKSEKIWVRDYGQVG